MDGSEDSAVGASSPECAHRSAFPPPFTRLGVEAVTAARLALHGCFMVDLSMPDRMPGLLHAPCQRSLSS
jgi:hypothetical protein